MKELELNINMFTFEDLTRQTIQQATKLMEFFKLNLIYYQLISGKGLEFDKIKEYTLGDDVRRIDWNIFARTKEVNIRVYKEERHFDIIIVLDVSNSMLLGTSKFIKNEFASLIAGTLAFAAKDADDQIAAVMISDKVTVAEETSSDFYHFLRTISRKGNYGGKKDWKKLVDTLLTQYDDSAIIFLISDFIDFDPDLVLPPLSAAFTKVFGIMVRDQIDNRLPEGVGSVYLTDTNGSKVYLSNFNDLKEEYEVLTKREIKKIKNAFLSEGQLFFSIETGQDFSTEFIKAFDQESVEK